MKHILAEHSKELITSGMTADVEGVCLYIQRILQARAKIHCEFHNSRGNDRPMVVSSRFGTVILEKQNINEETVYSGVVSENGK